jgi:hypothetical protein
VHETGPGQAQRHSLVKPTSPNTVTLCAESNSRRLEATNLSNLDTCVAFALWCAARNRATFCSGVSRGGGAPEPAPGDKGPDLGGVKRDGGAAAFELAWGVVAVNRVASVTLRGAVDIAMIICPGRGSSTGSSGAGRAMGWRV